jgi:hypothetical protein
VCGQQFKQKNRSETVTCSKPCQVILGVRTRFENDSYKQDDKQKIKRANSLKEFYKTADHNIARTKQACKLVYDSSGVLIQKECTNCNQILLIEKFKRIKTFFAKTPKCGYATYCHKCELSLKEARRRKAGYKPKRILTIVKDKKDNIIEKECTHCGLVKPLQDFKSDKYGFAKRGSYCKKCEIDKYYIKKYGINTKDKEQMYKNQNGICSICGQQYEIKQLHVDHDHIKQKVRDLLCSGCNKIYGVIGDGLDPKTTNVIIGLIKYYIKYVNNPNNIIMSFNRMLTSNVN